MYNTPMKWFNYYGLAIVVLFLIPNIIFAFKNKSAFENAYKNKILELFEQIGRYGCFILMIFNIPYTYFNFWFENALIVYLTVDFSLLAIYLLTWAFFSKLGTIARSLILSIVPSIIFLASGVLLANIPLLVCAVIFTVCHITLSYKNAVLSTKKEQKFQNKENDNL